jgi:hypothetical protein
MKTHEKMVKIWRRNAQEREHFSRAGEAAGRRERKITDDEFVTFDEEWLRLVVPCFNDSRKRVILVT